MRRIDGLRWWQARELASHRGRLVWDLLRSVLRGERPVSDKPAVDAVEREFWDRGRQFRVWDLPARAGDPAPVFVLLHGLGTASRLYHHTVHHLRPHGRILVVDMPGFGDLARPQGPMGIADFAESIGRVLARMGIEAPVLVGHSMGTQVAVELARQHQHLRGRMVLVAPVVHPRRRTIPRLLLAFVLGSLRERPGAAPVSIRGYLQMGLGWPWEVLPSLVHHPLEDRIQGLGGRLEIVRGEHDLLSTSQWANELLTRSGAQGSVTLVKGASHQILVDDADQVAATAAEVAGR